MNDKTSNQIEFLRLQTIKHDTGTPSAPDYTLMGWKVFLKGIPLGIMLYVHDLEDYYSVPDEQLSGNLIRLGCHQKEFSGLGKAAIHKQLMDHLYEPEPTKEQYHIPFDIIRKIEKERQKQIDKWGAQTDHDPLYWNGILVEEVGETSQALIENKDEAEYEYELIQCAAVIVAWLEANAAARSK